ncbi:putative secreted protein [Rhodopirellula sp. SWK7]|nr:putative secreted protein [Rhodopirellula sp. SWK7]
MATTLKELIMKSQTKASLSLLGLLCLLTATTTGCGGNTTATASATPSPPAETGIPYQKFADAVHAVMMADRTVYASKVVTRLKKQDAPVTPSEYWEDEEHTIPLPAQMFRMGSELVFENPEAGFTYALKSKWPLNEQNRPKSDFEIQALDYLVEHPDENFYGEEELGGEKYFVAAYADKAVAEACWSCHNDHGNREDNYPEFVKDDVMGGVIVRVPMQ